MSVTLNATKCPECGNEDATVETDFTDGTTMVYCEKCGYYHTSEVNEEVPE